MRVATGKPKSRDGGGDTTPHTHTQSCSRVTGSTTKQAAAYTDWQSCSVGVHVSVCACTH